MCAWTTSAAVEDTLYYVAVVAPCIYDILEVVMFPRPVDGSIMTGEKRDLFYRFKKMKPPTL